MSSDNKDYSHTAYDDAFRIIEEECDDVLIPFVNHMFGEKYDKTAKVIRLRNEHHFEHKGGTDGKRITDSHFRIISSETEKDYQIECESMGYSDSIRIRLFQYAIQTAIDESCQTALKVTICIPHSGLLILRDRGKAPKTITFEICTPGGTLSYEVPVICESAYSLDDIFENELYFLLPFYFFNLEERLDVYASNEEELKEFEKIYCEIIKRIEKVPDGNLSLRSKGVIIKQMASVTKRLAENREYINQKVGDIMGGKVIKMEWLERFDAAVAEGKAEGKAEIMIRLICRKIRKGKTLSQIVDELEEEENIIKPIYDVAVRFAPEYDEEKILEALNTQKTA